MCFIVQDGKVLLAEIEYPDGRRLWNGIGGVIEEDETPAQAASREISEETKLSVSPQYIEEATVVESDDLKLHVLVAHEWGGQLETVDPSLKQLQWFSFDEVPYQKMHNGNDKWLPPILSKSQQK